jgi:hypothetical protein
MTISENNRAIEKQIRDSEGVGKECPIAAVPMKNGQTALCLAKPDGTIVCFDAFGKRLDKVESSVRIVAGLMLRKPGQDDMVM